MKGVIKAEVYKLKHYKLIWCMPVLFAAIGYVCSKIECQEFYMYKELEFFACPSSMGVYMGFLVVLIVGYITGADFSWRTIQNALSVGVGRRSYYFARLAVQLILAAALVILSIVANCAFRMLDSRDYSDYPMELLGAKFAVYVGIVVLQYLAIVTFLYMLSYFLKNQLISMLVGLFALYGEFVAKTLLGWYDIHFLDNILKYLPTGALQDMWTCVTKNRIFEIDFLKYGVSAVVMILAFGLIGYLKFVHDDCRGE